MSRISDFKPLYSMAFETGISCEGQEEINRLNEEIIKPGIVRQIVKKIENNNNVVVSPEMADMVLTAFLDTVTDIVSEGDIIKLKGYMTIYPQLYKSKQIKNVSDKSIVNIPARYKAKIKTGTKWNNACEHLKKGMVMK